MNKLRIAGLLFTAVVILSAVVIASLYLFSTLSQSNTGKSKAVQNEIKKTLEKVAQLMVLPKDEEPTVATVADKAKLESQPFFKSAQNGDKVLIYVKAGVAILYRPSVNKIVTVAPVQTVAGNSGSPTPSVAVTQKIQKPQIVLYNGTTKTGITFTVERLITGQFKDIEVADKVAAVKTDYAKTLVVDVSQKYSAKARDIANALSAEIGALPAGEKKPLADILVIVGQDKVQ